MFFNHGALKWGRGSANNTTSRKNLWTCLLPQNYQIGSTRSSDLVEVFVCQPQNAAFPSSQLNLCAAAKLNHLMTQDALPALNLSQDLVLCLSLASSVFARGIVLLCFVRFCVFIELEAYITLAPFGFFFRTAQDPISTNSSSLLTRKSSNPNKKSSNLPRSSTTSYPTRQSLDFSSLDEKMQTNTFWIARVFFDDCKFYAVINFCVM